MPVYLWRNTKTGETIEVARLIADIDVPPYVSDSEDWERIVAPFGVGRVEGGGSSPGRSSVKATKDG